MWGARGGGEAEIGDAAIIRAFGRNPHESDIEDVLADVATGSRRARTCVAISWLGSLRCTFGSGLTWMPETFAPRRR